MATPSAANALVSLQEIQKTNTFTSKLPPDPAFETPEASDNAPREALHPRIRGMKDIGLKSGEEQTQEFKDMVCGNKIFWNGKDEHIYPWAQCYGGFQFGVWAGQLGDGRAISLFESTNPVTGKRYEIQLKGAGLTPYSRFADGRAVLRSSIREFVASEYLNALGIPTTRALALVHLPNVKVRRERLEPGAIVTRFAESWIRLGTFDLLRSRQERAMIRQLATYVVEEVFGGWEKLPSAIPVDEAKKPHAYDAATTGIPRDEIQGQDENEQNRFARFYRHVCRVNASTVAKWQAYGFMNGVLNTDNTSIMGLSLDFGPYAFMDTFDSRYTPNHDDGTLRYSYKNQPHIIWWNLVRFGEALGELIGAGSHVDDETFVEKGVTEEFAKTLTARAENIIMKTGDEYTAVFLAEYKELMSRRLGLRSRKDDDMEKFITPALDFLEALELDYNHFFRTLSGVSVGDIGDDDKRKEAASLFFHKEGFGGTMHTERSARSEIAAWLEQWRERVISDWGSEGETERQQAMKAVNPKFVPSSWVLDETIKRVQEDNDKKFLEQIMAMTLDPFKEEWGFDQAEEERLCGDPPRFERKLMCSCSS
ncbi:YdiU domain-containing protein [Ascosphaera apis ARSEF 7405]|uniref:Selenoprotein O n=1 Tax=Ascosphaera apis ARSEF 7405 TaxID=392613 RepID=A0A168CWA8_9EURO|nr:YdiU domain-containing protein [Ascosphaera apis ARSEF 7405]